MAQHLVRLNPIPSHSPVPPGVVALIGGITGDQPIFGLVKDGQEICILAPCADYDKEEIDPEDPFYDFKVIQENRKLFARYLEEIQALLPQIDFGRTKTGYLIRSHNLPREFKILQRPEDITPPEYHFRCFPWATYIQEDEIEITVWGGLFDRRGFWKRLNGSRLDVDIVYAWNAMDFKKLDAAMFGYRAVEGLDLTFEVYGHLLDRNGRIIGLVTEAAWGRMVKSSDRSLVWGAIAKLQKRGLIYKGCLTNRFVIANNKVRLVELNQIAWYYGDQEKLSRESETYHWSPLRQLFGELNQFGPHGNNRLPLIKFTTTEKSIVLLPYPLASPYIRVSGSYSKLERFARTFGFKFLKPDDEDDDRPYSASSRNSSPRGRLAPRFSISSSSTRNTYSPRLFISENLTTETRLENPQQNHGPHLSYFPYRRTLRVQIRRETVCRTASSADTDDDMAISVTRYN
ncbi:hypothetical protein HYPSUDRAFT_166185 [Hypholoma sublateritium FD-334 SS-4]|uniref:Uncharacterized protein n=1 Tax=Hypholoma sublateritium (strain FD-334 SS-4) TaxID=945553 RepID=A0A0D2NQK2_HYPSF|nr:hypothetical protein HYPSUDRAFT_166185 [Hypholoma sublateritium FD-334 SS-4]